MAGLLVSFFRDLRVFSSEVLYLECHRLINLARKEARLRQVLEYLDEHRVEADFYFLSIKNSTNTRINNNLG